MATAGKSLKSEAPGHEVLTVQAKLLDGQIRAAVTAVHYSLTELGRLLTQMRQLALWQYLPDSYRGWEHYVQEVIGSRAHSSLYEIVAAHTLTQGACAVPPAVVNRMGVKRAAQVARLEPQHRTPEIVQAAMTESVVAVRNRVQAKLNESLPADEQKPATAMFAINLPLETIDDLEELLEIMVHMEGVRDGDTTLSMRQKSFHTMIWATKQFLAEELAEALQLKRAKEGIHDSQAGTAQEDLP
jgi:hypothetical protein